MSDGKKGGAIPPGATIGILGSGQLGRIRRDTSPVGGTQRNAQRRDKQAHPGQRHEPGPRPAHGTNRQHAEQTQRTFDQRAHLRIKRGD